MCTDVHLSIESKSIIRGKNFNHPTLHNIHSKSLYYQIIINNNNNNNPTESKMKLQTNASNGIMGMDFILVIYLVITVSFAFRSAVLSLTDTLFHCLPGREILKTLPNPSHPGILHYLKSIYMYVRKRNSKIRQSWNSSISQRLSPFLRIIATEQAILLHNGENHIVTSGDSDSACPISTKYQPIWSGDTFMSSSTFI